MIHAGRDTGYKHISNRKAHKDGAQYGLQLAGEAGGPGPPIWNYSGTGIYHKTIHVPAEWLGPDQGVFLDLGEVRELAEIFNNGKSAGVLWKPPFRVDATALVRPGANELKTEGLR